MERIITEDHLKQTIVQFWETVPMVWSQIRGHLRSVATEQFEISEEQFHLLRHIRRGRTSVSELADVRQISRSAASQAAELLVEKGLITRRQETDDRRFVRLALTPQGEELIDKIFQQNRAWMMEKMAHLSPADLADITAGLALLRSAFEPAAEKSQEPTALMNEH